MKQLETQLLRWMRLVVFAAAASPAAHALTTSWSTRWPILGAGVGVLELAWRQFIAPTMPATSTPPITAQEKAELAAAIATLTELLPPATSVRSNTPTDPVGLGSSTS
jgi:hypothetical protein